MWKPVFFSLTLLSLFLIRSINAWDTDDLEIFDLVEEINKNFYEVFGVDQLATSSEIRKSYRRLSLQMHPDKGGEEEAFQQLNLMYEVLKDSEKRKKYDLVLEHGLPDWKQPVFYYRRARKLGLLEMSGLLMLILTVGQFLVSWAGYLEKKFEREEVFRSAKRRQDKKSRKKKSNMDDDEFEEQLQENLKVIPKPQIKDLIPCRMVLFAWSTTMNLPEIITNLKERMKKVEVIEEVEEEDDSEVKKKRRQRIETPDVKYESANITDPVVSYSQSEGEGHNTIEATESASKEKMEGNWTDEELFLLTRATVKFPGGTPKRWEKIAQLVGRPVDEVAVKAKEVKMQYAKHVDPASQGTVGTDDLSKLKKAQVISDKIISTRVDQDFVDTAAPEIKLKNRQKPTKVTKPNERTLLISEQPTISAVNTDKSHSLCENAQSGEDNLDIQLDEGQIWTQNQQKALEWALAQYPKGTDDRWDKIAEQISGKSKEDCIARFKHLADMVKKRKNQKAS